MSIDASRIRRIIAEETRRVLREGSEEEDLMMKFIEAQREIADQFRSLHGDKPDPIDNVRQDVYAVVSKVNDEAERVGFDVEEYMEALKSALEEKGVKIEFRIDDYSDRPLTDIEVISGDSDDDHGDEEDEDMDESSLNEGMTFRISPDMPPEILRNLRPGDKIPAEYLIPSSLSPEEGPGARAAMRMREPEILSVGKSDFLSRKYADRDFGPDFDEEEENLDEAKKRRKPAEKKLAKLKNKKSKIKESSLIGRLDTAIKELSESWGSRRRSDYED